MTCMKCNCVYEYDDADIVVVKDAFLRLITIGEEVRYVECPECGTPFNIRNSEQGNEYGMKVYMEGEKNE